MVFGTSNIGSVLLLENLMSINSNSKTELLTPMEIARMLKISKAGVYRLVDKRLIPFYKVMGGLRFDKNDVLSYLQNNRVESVELQNYGNTKTSQQNVVDRF